MKKRFFQILKLFLGLSILFLLFYKVGFSNMFNTIIKLKFIFLSAAIFVYFLSLILGVININLFLRAIGKKINFLELIKFYFLSLSFGMLLPGKVGDFSLVFLLKHHNINMGEGSSVVIFDKIITLLVILVLLLFGILIYTDLLQYWALLIMVMVVIISFIVFIFSNFGRNFIKKFFLKKYSYLFKGFSKSLNIIIKKYFLLGLNILITLIKLIFSFSIVYFLFLSLGTHVAFIDIFFISALLTIITLIPITISGLGVRESSAIFFFYNIGVDPTITLSVYSIILFIKYITALIVFSLFKFSNLKGK